MFRASPPWLSLSCSPPLFCLSLLIDLSASTVFTVPQSEYTVKIYNPLRHSSTHQAPVVPISPKEAKLLLQLTVPMLLLLSHFSQVRLFATPWTAAHQAPLSMGFSRQEYWSGCHALLQGISPTRGLNVCLMSPALAGRFFTPNATWEAHSPFLSPSSLHSGQAFMAFFFFSFLSAQEVLASLDSRSTLSP